MCLGLVIGKSFARLALRRLGGAFGGQGLTCSTNLAALMYCHKCHLPKLTFRWMRVFPMAVRRLNATIQSVDDKLSALVAADLPASIYCLILSGKVAAGAMGPVAFYIPATFGIVNDMMRRTSHTITPCVP